MTDRKAHAAIAHNIRTLREMHGLSQVGLATQSGLTSAAISMFEAGKRKPSFDSLLRIKRAFGVPWNGLLKGVE